MGLSATHTTTLCHSWSGQHSSAITEIMRGFKCKTTGQDVFTDSFKIELLHDLMYKVHGSYKTEDYTISDALIGGNKSEEDGAESNVAVVADIAKASELVEADYIVSSKEKKEIIKTYSKKVIKKIKEEQPDKVANYQKNLPTLINEIVKDCKRLHIYYTNGDEFDKFGMPILVVDDEDLSERSAKPGDKFKLYAWYDELDEEKY